MSNSNASFDLAILGASDPEMKAIEGALRAAGVAYAYATGPDGKRVNPGNAYQAKTALLAYTEGTVFRHYPPGTDFEPAPGTRLALVECDVNFPVNPDDIRVVVVDHHRVGDPGFGRPPAEFWEASSLGQMSRLLGREGDATARVVAAADHCPGAAYRGKCPGVDPGAVLAFRAASQAAFRGVAPEVLIAEIEGATAALLAAPRVDLDTLAGTCTCGEGCGPEAPHIGEGCAAWRQRIQVADMRRAGEVRSLPEAALRAGLGFLADVVERGTDRRKAVLGGDNSPDVVRAFLAWARGYGELVEPYGDPARGFAGAYYP